VASIHNNLGAVYMNTDRFADAASHFQSARDVMVTRLGPRHPHAITTLNNLAGVAEEAGDLERAEVLRRDVLAQLAGVVPEWSVHRRMALKNLGTLLVKTGDYEEAETHLNESLNLRRMFLPAPHPKIASTLSGLGELYRARQRWDEAVAVYREALEMRKATTPDHVQTVMMQLYLGDALRGAGAYEEAEPLVVEGYEKIQTRPNVKQLWQQEAADVLSRFYTSRDERRRTGSLRDSRAEIGSEIDAAAPTATTAAN
jgi:tetratricopeptide (TPR) repeat protein